MDKHLLNVIEAVKELEKTKSKERLIGLITEEFEIPSHMCDKCKTNSIIYLDSKSEVYCLYCDERAPENLYARDAYPETMDLQTTMQYLSEVYKFPCRSRKNFYKLEEHFLIPHFDLNPGGKNKRRLFKKSDLDEFAKNPHRFQRKQG